ncbi:MAG: hypothetical protein KC486_13475 [Myxococcales bacterium]|nr:hypothetical protein [Myxococcales bacterium]
MPPPRPPIFLGKTIVAREASWDATEVLEIRPRGGNTFASPHGTHALYVPLRRVVSVTPAGAAVELVGDFSMTNYPPRLRLAPVDPDDARKLSEAMARRYGLPLLPLEVPSIELGRGRPLTLVCVADEVRASHPDLANFAGLRVRGGDSRTRTPGERLRVTGFYNSGFSGDGVRPVGYSGPSLGRVFVEGERLCSVSLDHLGGSVDAWIGDGHGRYLEVRSPTQRLVGLLHGHCAQGIYPWALEGHRRALRGLLAGAPEGRLPDDPSPLYLNGWVDTGVAAAASRGPLPESAAELLSELDARLGVVFNASRGEPRGFAADGVLTCVEGRRITALRRGVARIYRVAPDGAVHLEVAEDGLLPAAEAEGPEVESWRARVASSCFGALAPAEPGPRAFDLADGERLLIVTGEALRQRDEATLLAALAAPDLEDVAAALIEGGEPLEGARWGLMAIAPGVDAES